MLRHAHLPRTLFAQPRITVDTDGLFALYDALDALSPAPAVGLALAAEARPEQYDPVAIAGLYSRDLRDAIGRIARYKALVCPERIELTAHGDGWQVCFTWTLGEGREPPALVDHCFGWVVGIARHGLDRSVAPLRVELRRPPAHAAVYEAFFGCPVVFDAAVDRLLFDRAVMAQPFTSHNADLLELIAPRLDAELEQQIAATRLSEQVKGVVKSRLAGQTPTVQQVARELCMSARTLQRRLGEQAASFRGLIDEARHELARHYLSRSQVELIEVAFLVGYEDANSFFRAFRRWEGMPPGQWRAAHAG